ncbi:hypothetical protein J6590_072219 [Homalodisca vitripennis]|nr:hypothetical protein J6590_072219 [Homalodisca vitripennis]
MGEGPDCRYAGPGTVAVRQIWRMLFTLGSGETSRACYITVHKLSRACCIPPLLHSRSTPCIAMENENRYLRGKWEMRPRKINGADSTRDLRFGISFSAA